MNELRAHFLFPEVSWGERSKEREGAKSPFNISYPLDGPNHWHSKTKHPPGKPEGWKT